MPRSWRTKLSLATEMDSQSEIAAYPALADIFDSLSLDNVPSDSVWHKLPNSSRQDVLDTRLMLMKIGQTQYREKGHTQEESKAMEESLANSLAAVNINSELNSALESSASGEPFTSKSEPQYGKAKKLAFAVGSVHHWSFLYRHAGANGQRSEARKSSFPWRFRFKVEF
ncbi:uncharacterized protein BT62DRAFT_933480 [Guyanagaster necrorhizus]|uniref:Uncharacterized protein n=1 Tax=Guyanagaster necrorhizus TaxID=856835 RepID=A0A9P7VR46_9AGAR|nr:uncharacterized protein BT62DRAFT_933480 [Guyanagaster necrorhizus MCA 3950]KAG7445062.1 hypothetical protein BT62DRAFT_933480 [Guyanagaster necrorhizus MCA 3950]